MWPVQKERVIDLFEKMARALEEKLQASPRKEIYEELKDIVEYIKKELQKSNFDYFTAIDLWETPVQPDIEEIPEVHVSIVPHGDAGDHYFIHRIETLDENGNHHYREGLSTSSTNKIVLLTGYKMVEENGERTYLRVTTFHRDEKGNLQLAKDYYIPVRETKRQGGVVPGSISISPYGVLVDGNYVPVGGNVGIYNKSLTSTSKREEKVTRKDYLLHI